MRFMRDFNKYISLQINSTKTFNTFNLNMKLSLIGAGNTGTVLARLIHNKGLKLVDLWSRNPLHAEELASKVDGRPIQQLHSLSDEADLFLIAVPDTAIESVVHPAFFHNKPVFHTAGSVSRNVLQTISSEFGVLYPLQSLRKEQTRIPKIPFLIDGNTDTSLQLIEKLARILSDDVQLANDEQRLHYHLAAVVSGNFTNHLYSLTEQFCKTHDLNFLQLLPLIQEIAERLNTRSPVLSQTGPAARGDIATIEHHLTLLEKEPGLQKIYRIMSDSIREFQSKNQELHNSF